jgi:hypothetical protein
LPDGESEAEDAAVPGLALGPKVSAVELDELAGEREPEAGALGFLFAGLFELFEDRVQLLGSDPRACIGDRDLDLAVFEASGDVDATIGRSELDRVGDEIEDDLAEAALIGGDRDLLRVGGEESPTPARAALSECMETAPRSTSGRSTWDRSSSIRPASIFARSRTSLISESRCRPAASTSST